MVKKLLYTEDDIRSQFGEEGIFTNSREYLPVTAPTRTVALADADKILTNKGNTGNCVLSIDPAGMSEANTLLIFEVAAAHTMTIQGIGGSNVRFLNSGDVTTTFSSALMYGRLSIRYAGDEFGGTNDFVIIINDGFGA